MANWGRGWVKKKQHFNHPCFARSTAPPCPRCQLLDTHLGIQRGRRRWRRLNCHRLAVCPPWPCHRRQGRPQRGRQQQGPPVCDGLVVGGGGSDSGAPAGRQGARRHGGGGAQRHARGGGAHLCEFGGRGTKESVCECVEACVGGGRGRRHGSQQEKWELDPRTKSLANRRAWAETRGARPHALSLLLTPCPPPPSSPPSAATRPSGRAGTGRPGRRTRPARRRRWWPLWRRRRRPGCR